MNTRLSANTNQLTHTQTRWANYPVQVHRGPLIVNYLERIQQTLLRANLKHKRTCAIRVDLYLPASNFEVTGRHLLTRFIESLKAQIAAHLKRKRREGIRVYPTDVRHIWVKEQSGSRGDHFHVLLLVNHDTYHVCGNYAADEGNMAARIKKAWASALMVDPEAVQARGLVHFPERNVYKLDRNSQWLEMQFEELFFRVSYFAKADTKQYIEVSHHFGCSQQ